MILKIDGLKHPRVHSKALAYEAGHGNQNDPQRNR
jgi:hypothetical protein